MSIGALVIGILSILLSIVGAVWPVGNWPTWIALILGVIAIILAVLGMKKSEKHGKATAGLVLAIIAVVISIVMLIACGGFKKNVSNTVEGVVNGDQDLVEQGLNNLGITTDAIESAMDDFADDLADAFNDVAN